jgi:hypothetical protein
LFPGCAKANYPGVYARVSSAKKWIDQTICANTISKAGFAGCTATGPAPAPVRPPTRAPVRPPTRRPTRSPTRFPTEPPVAADDFSPTDDALTDDYSTDDFLPGRA